jgi:hypothetical protein
MLKKMMTSGAMLAVLSFGAVDTAQAQFRSDKAIYFTFSQPVALPKTTLPAGKYLFRLADSLANRQIVQVYSGDGARLEAMMMTLPVRRDDPPNDAEVRFLETPAEAPAAIATYWYPGERQGWEFIYPRSQATLLAKSSNQPVLTTTSTSDDMKSGGLVRVSPSGEQVSASDQIDTSEAKSDRDDRSDDVAVSAAAQSSSGASQAAPVRSNQSAQSQSSASTPARVDTATMNETRKALPATASATPTVLLAGVLALAAALWLTRRAHA